MLFSILTPSWNYGRFIRDCLQSVALQSPDCQHLVADNESTDETHAILSETTDPGLTWWSRQDRGQSHALNTLLGRATGDIIGWLNADEFYLEWTLRQVEQAFKRHPDVDIIFGDTLFVDENGCRIRLVTRYPASDWVLRHRGCYISTCSTFVRRSVLADFLFDENLRVLMDWDMFLFLQHQRSRFLYVPGVVGAFRVHDQRVTAHLHSRTTEEHARVRMRYGLSTHSLVWPVQRLSADLVHGTKLWTSRRHDPVQNRAPFGQAGNDN